MVLGKKRIEPAGIAFRLVDALGSIALGGADLLFGLAFGAWHQLVVLAARLLDELLLFLLGAVHFIEACLHLAGRVHVQQLHLIDVHSHLERIHNALQALQSLGLGFLSPHGQHLVHGAVAHDFAHHRLRQVPQGVLRSAQLEEVLLRIGNGILHHPFHRGRIEVARDHGFLLIRLLRGLVSIGGAGCGIAKFHLQLAAGRDDFARIDAKRQLEMQAWFRRGVVLAEPKHDGHRIGRHRVKAGEQPEEQDETDQTQQKFLRADLDPYLMRGAW